jgi:hypothetical protein
MSNLPSSLTSSLFEVDPTEHEEPKINKQQPKNK